MPTLEVTANNEMGMWEVKLTTPVANCPFTKAVSPDIECALIETEMGFLGYRPFHKAKEPMTVVLNGKIPETDTTKIKLIFDSYAHELGIKTVYVQQ